MRLSAALATVTESFDSSSFEPITVVLVLVLHSLMVGGKHSCLSSKRNILKAYCCSLQLASSFPSKILEALVRLSARDFDMVWGVWVCLN